MTLRDQFIKNLSDADIELFVERALHAAILQYVAIQEERDEAKADLHNRFLQDNIVFVMVLRAVQQRRALNATSAQDLVRLVANKDTDQTPLREWMFQLAEDHAQHFGVHPDWVAYIEQARGVCATFDEAVYPIADNNTRMLFEMRQRLAARRDNLVYDSPEKTLFEILFYCTAVSPYQGALHIVTNLTDKLTPHWKSTLVDFQGEHQLEQ